MPKKQAPESVGRRNIIKALGISGAAATAKVFPEKWTRPVVDSVVLPAHAQPSPAMSLIFGGSGLNVTFSEDSFRDELYASTWLREAFEIVIPSARAQTGPDATVCAIGDTNQLDVTLQRSQNNARRQGTLRTDGTPGMLRVIAASPNCEIPPNDLNARIVDFSADDLVLQFAPDFVDVTQRSIQVKVDRTDVCPGFAALTGTCVGQDEN